MQLEDYFEFEKFPEFDHIRIKGTRIAIEVIIRDYLDGLTPEQIASNYRTISLEQVFATLAYYFRDKDKVDAYLERCRAIEDANYQEYLKQEPPEVVKRLRALRAERQQAVPQ